MSLVYSEQAVADLVRLRAFIAAHDPAGAARIAEALVKRIEHLTRFPRIGRAVAQAPQPDSVRDMTFGAYVIRYSVHETTLVILRVWHHLEDRAAQRQSLAVSASAEAGEDQDFIDAISDWKDA